MKNNLENDPIDFIVTWVDGDDPVWAAEREIYEKKEHVDSYATSGKCFHDWDLFKYWFRSVEKFAPWVHKIYFVTYGHIPKWLNIKNPKLVIVKHSDFMPKEYLPTYNSVALELNLHRIKGLSNQFVYFRKDAIIGKTVTPKDFFIDNKAKYNFIEEPLENYNKDNNHLNRNIIANTIEVINRNFKKSRLRNLTIKDFNVSFKNMKAILFEKYIGFKPCSYHSCLKNTYIELWKEEYDACNKTSISKFTSKDIIGSEIIDLWQASSGKTVHYNQRKKEYYCPLGVRDINRAKKHIQSKRYEILNFQSEYLEVEPNNSVQLLNILEEYLPDKSSFEK